MIELLELEAIGVHVAEYLSDLSPRAFLETNLHEAIVSTRACLRASALSEGT